jgi:PTH1 family peptidyl-tRNA hydrolase
MNLSGSRSQARAFKIARPDPRRMTSRFVCQMKPPGAATRKNGLKDIRPARCGDFGARAGHRHPGVKAEVVNYVLRKPPADERDAIERNIDESLKVLDLLVAGEMDRAVMKLHAKPARPKPPRPEGAPPAAEPNRT